MYHCLRITAVFLTCFFICFQPAFAEEYAWDISLPVPTDDPLWNDVKTAWQRHFEKKNVDDLLGILKQIEKKYPDKPELSLWLSKALFLKGKYEKKNTDDHFKLSEEYALKVLRNFPRDIKAMKLFVSAISAYQDVDYFRSNHASYLENIRLTPGRALPEAASSPTGNEAILLWDNREDIEKGKKAVALFKKMADEQPENLIAQLWAARGNYYVGYYYTSLDQHEKGLPFFRDGETYGVKALSIDPYNVPANYWRELNLARSIEETNILNKARHLKVLMNHLVFAANENPIYFYNGPVLAISTMVLKGGWVAEKGMSLAGYHMDTVIAGLDLGLLMYPDYFYIYLAKGMVFYHLGQKEEAKKIVGKMLEKDPNISKYHAAENMCVQRIAKRFLEDMK